MQHVSATLQINNPHLDICCCCYYAKCIVAYHERQRFYFAQLVIRKFWIINPFPNIQPPQLYIDP